MNTYITEFYAVRRVAIDFHYVAPQHSAIHTRLENWARYVLPRFGNRNVHPMFRNCLIPDIWVPPTPKIPIDSMDGHKMEKAVCQLPEKHRHAVQWSYVYRSVPPWRVCKSLAVTQDSLQRLVHDGRSMLKNTSTSAKLHNNQY